MPTKGVVKFLPQINNKKLTKFNRPIGISIGGNSFEEYLSVFSEIDHHLNTIDFSKFFYEINISCPNTDDGKCLSDDLESLKNLTNNIIHNDDGLWKKDIGKLGKLKKRQEIILTSKLSPIEKIYWLLEDCKRYGTLPFAGLARAGFIAVQLLQSLVQVGILSTHDYDNFMTSLNSSMVPGFPRSTR